MLEHYFGSVAPAAPIEPADHEESPDYGLADGHILNVEKVDSLPEGLRLMIAFDTEALARMATSKALLEQF